jgi:hypothetical protein
MGGIEASRIANRRDAGTPSLNARVPPSFECATRPLNVGLLLPLNVAVVRTECNGGDICTKVSRLWHNVAARGRGASTRRVHREPDRMPTA